MHGEAPAALLPESKLLISKEPPNMHMLEENTFRIREQQHISHCHHIRCGGSAGQDTCNSTLLPSVSDQLPPHHHYLLPLPLPLPLTPSTIPLSHTRQFILQRNPVAPPSLLSHTARDNPAWFVTMEIRQRFPPSWPHHCRTAAC